MIHLQTSNKDLANINSAPFKTLDHSLGHQFSTLSYDLHPPPHNRTESLSTMFPELMRPNALINKDRPKKVSVEDILAMRRLDQGSVQSNPEYPGLQPTWVFGEEEWLTYRFGHGNNGS
jgi:hypothetical protein